MSAADLPLGYYRHFKGGFYQVLGLARHCDTQDWQVYYRCCYGDWSYWVRPLDNLVQRLEVTGKRRFEFIGTQRPAGLESSPDEC